MTNESLAAFWRGFSFIARLISVAKSQQKFKSTFILVFIVASII